MEQNCVGAMTKDWAKSSLLHHMNTVCTRVVQIEKKKKQKGDFQYDRVYPHFPFHFDMIVKSKKLEAYRFFFKVGHYHSTSFGHWL